jgi:hypothetical protein
MALARQAEVRIVLAGVRFRTAYYLLRVYAECIL